MRSDLHHACLPWDAEHVAELRRCVGDGMTSRAAAERMSRLFRTDVTHSMLISKAKKIGLRWSNLRYGDKRALSDAAEAPSSPPASKPRRWTAPKLPPTVPAQPPRAIPPAPNSKPVDLMGLTNWTCHWPLWTDQEPARWYCGALEADVEGGRSYCWFHARAAKG